MEDHVQLQRVNDTHRGLGHVNNERCGTVNKTYLVRLNTLTHVNLLTYNLQLKNPVTDDNPKYTETRLTPAMRF